MEEELVDYKELVKSTLIYIIYLNSYYFRYIPIIIFNLLNIYSTEQSFSLLCGMIANIIMALVLIKLYWKELKTELKLFTKNIFEYLDTGLKYWGIGLIIMITANIILVYVFKSNGANNELLLREYIKQFPAIMTINICFTGPFIEEIVFRKTLKNAFPNPFVFISLSFLVFGSIHVTPYATNIVDYLYIIPYGTLGAAFALMYQKTDSVFTSMFYHSLHNTIIFLLVLFI